MVGAAPQSSAPPPAVKEVFTTPGILNRDGVKIFKASELKNSNFFRQGVVYYSDYFEVSVPRSYAGVAMNLERNAKSRDWDEQLRVCTIADASLAPTKLLFESENRVAHFFKNKDGVRLMLTSWKFQKDEATISIPEESLNSFIHGRRATVSRSVVAGEPTLTVWNAYWQISGISYELVVPEIVLGTNSAASMVALAEKVKCRQAQD
ncbi:hypothetical protein [Mitsuaria sp. GD03876]|uniref:hypothetical protein n=1 Tax=Mitsuaria sp. GD03876 TaxID=2975399 RepID=UPI00244C2C4E|nr:hypothetical protein [Mitsuaria sp. GD03876]MDH0866432.1 hypothetical protein [Mitsuaria sp. GD03876]